MVAGFTAVLREGGGLIAERWDFLYPRSSPFSDLLPLVGSEDEGSMRIVESYFRAEPYVEQGGLDYVGKSEYSANTLIY